MWVAERGSASLLGTLKNGSSGREENPAQEKLHDSGGFPPNEWKTFFVILILVMDTIWLYKMKFNPCKPRSTSYSAENKILPQYYVRLKLHRGIFNWSLICARIPLLVWARQICIFSMTDRCNKFDLHNRLNGTKISKRKHVFRK